MTSRLYRTLLLLTPGWFREEFATEMTAVFRDTVADARRRGRAAVLAVWITTVRDLMVLSARLHVEAARQDLIYAVRTLRRTPAFTSAAVLTLALGFGPTVVVANFVYQVLLAPLPFPEAERIVRIWNARPERKQGRIPLSLPDFMDFHARQSAFKALAAHTGTSVALMIGGSPRQIAGVITSNELHQALGVHPFLGRGLAAADTAPGAPPVIVLGAALWRNEFGSRADIVGEVIQVDGRPTTIIGVLPDGFSFPQGTQNAWLPLTLDPANTNRGSHFLTATGRLKDGVSAMQAQEALNGIARALGATGRRLRRQLMVEHVVLTVAGGMLGTLLGVGLHRAIISRRVLALPASAASMGWPAFALLAALVLLIGAAFAWMAARRSARQPASAALLGAVRQTGSFRLLRARQVLVVGEVAVALVLLVVGGLMLQSAARLSAVEPGFRTDGVLTFGVVLPNQNYPTPADRVRFAERVTEELRAVPGVRQAAVGGYAPMGEMRATRRFARIDRPLPGAGNEPVALDLPAGPGYFEVMGIRLVEGRTFSERDMPDSTPVMIVSEEFARTIFPGERAVGQRIRFYSARPGGTPPPTREIVGVVRDVRQDGVAQAPIMQMYSPFAQNPWGFFSFFALVDGDPTQLSAVVQRVINKVDPMRPARDVLPIRAIVRGSTERQRAVTWMLIALAATALLMATIGLYGVSATTAAARSRELAIRAAVGAHPAALLRLIVQQGLFTCAAGVVLGAAASLAATRGLGAFLYETEPRDPATFAATALLLLAVAAMATYLPARRALAANPAEVLRAE